MTDLSIGDPAPSFDLPSDTGMRIGSDALAGKSIVLYFYPKDDTPGCTKEAIGFSASKDEFAARNAVVLGVSKDPVTKHAKFVSKHELTVSLLSDEDSDTCERYGVWVEKNMYGRKYMGIERATFLIGHDGLIKDIWRKVKVPGHVDAVLAALKEQARGT